ncbi:hypothetical protein TeGR_g3263, partial [Tetraparma gracilis]
MRSLLCLSLLLSLPPPSLPADPPPPAPPGLVPAADKLRQKLEEDMSKITWVSEQLEENPDDKKKLAYLTEDILTIREDMNQLLLSLNETEASLLQEQALRAGAAEALEVQKVQAEGARVIEDIKEGRVKVDYETGVVIKDKKGEGGGGGDEVQSILTAADPKEGNEKGNATAAAAAAADDDPDLSKQAADLLAAALREDGGATPAPTPIAPPQLAAGGAAAPPEAEDLAAAAAGEMAQLIKTEISALKTAADPAVMQVDVRLLLDVVQLAIAASAMGVLAAFLRLPSAAGFLIGGMLIGPSWWDVVANVKEVQTLAQFGSVFILFEQGLLYAQQYFDRRHGAASAGKVTSPAPAPPPGLAAAPAAADARLAGSLLFLLTCLIAALSLLSLGSASKGPAELVIVSSAVALTSATLVKESLHAARLGDTGHGGSLLKLVAVQDIFMIPMLHWIAVALKADQLRSHSEGEVFTLSVVAYALMMATFTEENQVSLEAGALFAGIAVMKSPHIDKILTSIRPITSVFGGMYITAMGMIISPIFVANNLFTILLLAVMIGGMKMGVASVLLTKSYGYPLAVSSALCSSVAQISEGSLVVLAKAQRLGFVSRQT